MVLSVSYEMASGFEQRIADFVSDNGLLGPGGRVLLAVSGGADSTALLYAMCALKNRGAIDAEFACAHINHQLRGAEADQDDEFVRKEAEKLGLETRTRRVDVRSFARENRLSLETAARRLRIQSLLDIAAESGCHCVATAHQKDDNAETVVQRLARGTGIRGLGGIWPVKTFGRVRFIRPMLCVTRQEVIQYLKERGLQWRRDHTNADCTYRRNYIRHRLLPALQAGCTGSLVEQLFDLSRAARGYYALVCKRADEWWAAQGDLDGEKVTLDCERLSAEAKPVRVELIRRRLAAVGCGEKAIAQEHYEKMLELAERNTGGRRIELPGGFVARREHTELIFERAQGEQESATTEDAEIEIPGRTAFGAYLIRTTILQREEGKMDSCLHRNDKGLEKYIEVFDLDKVKLPVVVRSRRDGDRFVPLGMGAVKKVGKFLSDARVPSDVRRKALVVEDCEKVIWVWPIRMSEQAKVTDQTGKILQVEITDALNPGERKELER